MKKIIIEIDDDSYKKLQVQLNFFREIKHPSFRDIYTVEQLVNFYVEQFASSEYDLKEMHKTLDSVLTLFSNKKPDISKIIRATFEDDDDLDDEGDDGDDDEDYVPTKKLS